MDTTITTEPVGKRARNGSVILTDRMCEKRVAKRVKFYDRKCPGLYVSITTAGVATFSFKFTDPATGKQRTGWLGVYNAETFTVEDEPSRRAGVRHVTQGPPLGTPEAGAKSMTETRNYYGSDPDGVAEAEADHFMKCPGCGEWFDMRDLDQLLAHVHDAEIEICEGPATPLRFMSAST